MRAGAGLDQKIVVECLRKSLDKLSFSYHRSEGRFVTEFEITSPCQVLVTVEDLTAVQPGLLFRVQLRRESAVEIRRVIGSREAEGELRRCASLLAKELLESLPREPWWGTGFMRSRRERANWERLGDI